MHFGVCECGGKPFLCCERDGVSPRRREPVCRRAGVAGKRVRAGMGQVKQRPVARS